MSSVLSDLQGDFNVDRYNKLNLLLFLKESFTIFVIISAMAINFYNFNIFTFYRLNI